MPGTTSRYSLPYPIGTDKVGTGDSTLKAIAEAIDTRALYTADFGTATMGRRAYNLCSYSENIYDGLGSLVIQTNILDTSTIMSTINITGMVYGIYDNGSSLVDISLKWYSFSDGVQHRWEVIKIGSYQCNVQIWSRNSDNKVAIVLTPLDPYPRWSYPKIAVDGIFGHTTTDESFMQGWTMFRTNSLAGYTVKQAPETNRPSGEDTGWQGMLFQGGWSQYDPVSNNFPALYRRKGGICYVRGLVKPPATGSANTITQLPVGFRPYKNTLRPAVDSNGIARMLYVYADGRIQANGGMDGYSWFSIDNVSFPITP